jgi:hypothetical protein
MAITTPVAAGNLKFKPPIWSASCLNSQRTRPIHPLRIEDNLRSASN